MDGVGLALQVIGSPFARQNDIYPQMEWHSFLVGMAVQSQNTGKFADWLLAA